jgi:hypothetical protein
VGAFGGYDRAALTLEAGANAVRDRRYRVGAYAATTLGTAYINAALAAADHRFETTRHLAFVAELAPQFGGGPLFGGIDRSTAALQAWSWSPVETHRTRACGAWFGWRGRQSWQCLSAAKRSWSVGINSIACPDPPRINLFQHTPAKVMDGPDAKTRTGRT